jgi:argininosuccinate lyase
MKLWQGSYHKQLDAFADDFNSSISFDWVLYPYDIAGSIAHATMLAEQEIISREDGESIVAGLREILADLESGKLVIDKNAEDIHSFVEGELTKRIGDAGKRLHTARSRNDQVALDLRMYAKAQVDEILDGLFRTVEALTKKAEKHTDTVMPGYTHLQIAQPVTFAHHLMAYVQMFLRDADRLLDAKKRLDEMPLGSGALATTTFPVDRWRVCELLGFSRPTENSMDGVSDRDFVVEICSALSLVMAHLSRLSEELILWTSQEFGFLRMDDAYSTGSSIMPQKKNPDMAELIRGKAGRVFGNNMALLTMLKALPLAYNKDLQEDKEGFFDSIETVKHCLAVMAPMVETVVVDEEAMRRGASRGFINATDCADYLTKKGVPFREAYRITGDLVGYCVENSLTLEELTLEQYQELSPVFDEGIYAAISLENCLAERKVYGGPAKETVLVQIENAKAKINALNEEKTKKVKP